MKRTAFFAILLTLAALLPASPSITLTTPATFSQPNASETDTLAAASEVFIRRASKSVVINYAIGTSGANGEVQAGQFSKTYTLTINNWTTGAWTDSLGNAGTLTGPQITSLQTQLNSICDASENLVLALGKLSGSKHAC